MNEYVFGGSWLLDNDPQNGNIVYMSHSEVLGRTVIRANNILKSYKSYKGGTHLMPNTKKCIILALHFSQ